MSFKGALIIIGVLVLAVLITFGVEELRFKFTNRTLLTEVKALGERNQNLVVKNDALYEQTKTLRAQLETKAQEYKEKINQLEEEVKGLGGSRQNTSPLGVEVRILQEKNQYLQDQNDNIAKHTKTLQAQLETRIQQNKEEKQALEKKISRLEKIIIRARATLTLEE